MKKHIFLTGDKQVGKSTLLRKSLEGEPLSLGGFLTVKTTVVQSRPTVHLLSIGTSETPSLENLLFVCGEPRTKETYRRFDGLGCAALESSPSADLLIMDELGPAEAGAASFQEAVCRLLDADVPIMGVLQKADAEFMRRIEAHPCVQVLEVTAENRDRLLPVLKRWMKGNQLLPERKFLST